MLFLKKPIDEPLLLIIAVVLVLLTPLAFILISPILLFRECVKYYVKRRKPELSEILTGYSSYFACMHKKPHCNGGGSIVTDDTVDIDGIEEVITSVLSSPEYLKAKQCLVTFMGFHFWKHCPNFRTRDHLIVHEETMTHEHFERIRDDDFVSVPFKRGRPLWELHIFQNFEPENPEPNKKYKMVCIRMHHSLLDWLSFVSIFSAVKRVTSGDPSSSSGSGSGNNIGFNNNEPDPKAQDHCKKQNATSTRTHDDGFKNLQKTLLKSYLVFKHMFYGPFELYKTMLVCQGSALGNYINEPLTFVNHAYDTRVPLARVKAIAAKHGVRSVAVVFAGMSGALRQLLEDLDINPLPESLGCCGPVPLPWKRPKGLHNFFSAIPIPVPVGESDPFKRLLIVNSEFDKLKYSTRILGYYSMFKVVGSLLYWIIGLLARIPTGQMSMSMAPGPDLLELLGVNTKHFTMNGGMPFGYGVLVGFYSLCVNQQLLIRIKGDSVVFKDQSKCRRFIDVFLRQLDILEKRP